MTEHEGVFPLWKSAGMTSHDCVSKARKLFRMKRIGHTGTLDPDVSGVLPLCLGRATRIVEYLQELPKTYEAEMTIGYATDTEDASGSVVETAERVDLQEADIRAAAEAFVGEIEQTPPMYSAVKSGGRRLYELAREGLEVERKPRIVTIYELVVREIRKEGPFWKMRFTATCSKGTYIRTLCVDIGRSLGYPAVMSALERTASGPFRKEMCVTFEEAERLLASGELDRRIVPIGDALSFLPRGFLSENAVVPALQGRKIFESAVRLEEPKEGAAVLTTGADGLVRLYGGSRMIGLYRKDSAEGRYVPVKLFT